MTYIILGFAERLNYWYRWLFCQRSIKALFKVHYNDEFVANGNTKRYFYISFKDDLDDNCCATGDVIISNPDMVAYPNYWETNKGEFYDGTDLFIQLSAAAIFMQRKPSATYFEALKYTKQWP